MPDKPMKIAIDDIIEAATNGVLRAMEARSISAIDFTSKNGFQVKIDVMAGGWPDPGQLNGTLIRAPGDAVQ